MQAAFHRILFATDFSEAARMGQQYAMALAEIFNAELHAIHVVSEDVFVPSPEAAANWRQAEIERSRKQLVAEIGAGHPATLDVCQGGAVQEILKYATAQNIDLIVIGTHGRTGLSHLLLGSVAEKVVRMATCPVLTVHPKGKLTDQKPEAE